MTEVSYRNTGQATSCSWAFIGEFLDHVRTPAHAGKKQQMDPRLLSLQ